MSDLHVLFAVVLARHDRLGTRPHGPLFYRWLPNGRNDALALEDEGKSYRLEMWFERRGFMEHGFIRYDDKRREVDETVIPWQSVLDAGYLRGQVLLTGLSASELEAVTESRTGDPEYVRLGKRVVKVTLTPPSSALRAFYESSSVSFGWTSSSLSTLVYTRSAIIAICLTCAGH